MLDRVRHVGAGLALQIKPSQLLCPFNHGLYAVVRPRQQSLEARAACPVGRSVERGNFLKFSRSSLLLFWFPQSLFIRQLLPFARFNA